MTHSFKGFHISKFSTGLFDFSPFWATHHDAFGLVLNRIFAIVSKRHINTCPFLIWKENLQFLVAISLI